MADMTLSRFGRGTCPVCDRNTALTKTGLIRQHGSGDGAWPPRTCAGVGQPPKEN
jgi:hypothetical protein